MVSAAAIVTGASAGIGLAIASMLAEEGYALTIAARDPVRLDDAATKLRAAGCTVGVVSTDLAAPGAADELVAVHQACFGRLDLVAANAGTGRKSSASRTRRGELAGMLELNVVGLFEMAAAALPAMRTTAEAGGHPWFVVTSSITGIWPPAGFAAYAATKAAGVSLARSITVEEARYGVRGCALCPGFVDTELSSWTKDKIPAETMLTAADVAEAVRFLLRLSPNATVSELVLGRVGAEVYAP